MQNQMQAFAIKYHQKNIPVFPVQVKLNPDGKAGKYPLISAWQNVKVSDFEKFDWTHANAIGMLTGKSSNTLVLDLDLGSDITGKPLPVTPCQRTGSGGMHYFFKYIEGVRNSAGQIGDKIDIRCDGGYVVIAPSWHPKGQYEWLIDLDTELADAPSWLVDNLVTTQKLRPHDVKLAFGAPEGTRNESAAKVIGHILSRIHPNYWKDFGLGGLREWNKRNTPPLPDDELVATFKSIAARQYAQKK